MVVWTDLVSVSPWKGFGSNIHIRVLYSFLEGWHMFPVPPMLIPQILCIQRCQGNGGYDNTISLRLVSPSRRKQRSTICKACARGLTTSLIESCVSIIARHLTSGLSSVLLYCETISIEGVIHGPHQLCRLSASKTSLDGGTS